jgi:endonuclease-3 related protein
VNRIQQTFDVLFEAFGEQFWWPGDSPWEIAVGAVLTQNTSWTNVEKAIDNLKAIDCLDPHKTLQLPIPELEKAIYPSGFFRMKTQRLRAFTAWWLENVNDESKLKPSNRTVENWRNNLLQVNGVGPETADSILLYAFDLPVFVIDAYTRRIASRHLGIASDISYNELQKIFMDNLSHDPAVYKEYHALLVHNAKNYCRKNECLTGCPLKAQLQ